MADNGQEVASEQGRFQIIDTIWNYIFRPSSNDGNVPGNTENLNPPPASSKRITILHLNDACLKSIFAYFDYQSIAELRLVCSRFFVVGSGMLNASFRAFCMQLPREVQFAENEIKEAESEDESALLIKMYDVVDILKSIVLVLYATFERHILVQKGTFFAGKFLDEMLKVLGHIHSKAPFDDPVDLTRNIREMACKAMDHFELKINNELDPLASDGAKALELVGSYFEGSGGDIVKVFHKNLGKIVPTLLTPLPRDGREWICELRKRVLSLMISTRYHDKATHPENVAEEAEGTDELQAGSSSSMETAEDEPAENPGQLTQNDGNAQSEAGEDLKTRGDMKITEAQPEKMSQNNNGEPQPEVLSTNGDENVLPDSSSSSSAMETVDAQPESSNPGTATGEQKSHDEENENHHVPDPKAKNKENRKRKHVDPIDKNSDEKVQRTS